MGLSLTISADTVNIDHYNVVVVPVPSIKVKMLKVGLLNMMMEKIIWTLKLIQTRSMMKMSASHVK